MLTFAGQSVCLIRGLLSLACNPCLIHSPHAPRLLHQVELPNGQLAAVYEHGMSLAIVALRGSVPQQWILDFKSALGESRGPWSLLLPERFIHLAVCPLAGVCQLSPNCMMSAAYWTFCGVLCPLGTTPDDKPLSFLSWVNSGLLLSGFASL